jgi:hypothetical protein
MNWWEWVFSGVGVLALGLLIEWVRRRPRSSGHEAGIDAKGAKVQRSPVASGAGITQNVGDTHHHHYPPAAAPPSQAPKQQPAPEPTPNIEYVGCKEKPVFISPFATDGFCDPRTADEDDNVVQAFVLRFENRPLPDRKISRAMNVIAKIRFQSESGGTERRLNYGVWLNSPLYHRDFRCRRYPRGGPNVHRE